MEKLVWIIPRDYTENILAWGQLKNHLPRSNTSVGAVGDGDLQVGLDDRLAASFDGLKGSKQICQKS